MKHSLTPGAEEELIATARIFPKKQANVVILITRLIPLWQPGQLLLLLQNADHTFCQLYLNTLTPPHPLGVGEHYLPGTLLDLSRHPTGQQRLCFLTPGVERVLGFLLPTLPGNIRVQEPMQRLSEAAISEILMTLQNEPHASMALATITVRHQAAP